MASSQRRSARRRVHRLQSWHLHDPWPVAAGMVACVVAVPILVVLGSLMVPQVETWTHLWHTQLPELIGNTLALIVGVGVGVAGLGTGLAWLVTMYRFPGRDVAEWCLILPLAVPAYVIAFVFLAIFDYAGPVQTWWRHLLGPGVWFPDIVSYGGVVFVMTCVSYPYVYILARAAFLEQSGTTLEAARGLGARRFMVFWRIAVPLARPSLAAGISLALMEALADFGTVAILNYSTFTVAIYRVWFGLFDRVAATQLASVLLLFTFTLYLLERALRGRARFYQTEGSVRPPQPIRLRGWKAWGASGITGLVVGVTFVLPVAHLLAWTLATVGGPDSDERFPTFMLNSLTVAVLTALVAVGAAVVVAYGLRLSRSRLMTFYGRLAGMGYALPGSVIAVGVLVPLAFLDRTLDSWLRATWGTSIGLLFTGSLIGLVFAYVVRFLAVSAHTVETSLGKVTPSMDMAGRSLGARPGRVLWRIHLPLIRGGLCSAAILVFVDVMRCNMSGPGWGSSTPSVCAVRPLLQDSRSWRPGLMSTESSTTSAPNRTPWC